MSQSESIANLAEALCAAQAEFPPILRTKHVTVTTQKGSYMFSYAPLDEIVREIRGTLFKHGLSYSQGMAGGELCTTIMHKSGEWKSYGMPMPQNHISPQAFGSEMAYRRRYGLTSALGLAPEEDDDGAAAARAADTSKPKTVAKSEWDKLPVDVQTWLSDIAMEVIAFHAKGDIKSAFERLELEKLDVDNKVAIWSRFDSKVRTALTKYGRSLTKETA